MMKLLQFPVQESDSQSRSDVSFEAYALDTCKLEQAAVMAREEACGLREELEALILQMEKLREHTLETEKENRLLHHDLLAAQKACHEQQQEVVHLKAEHSIQVRYQEKLKEELVVLQEENIQLQDQQTQLRHSLTESHGLCSSTQNTYNTLKNSYQALQDDLKNTQDLLSTAQVEKERLQTKSTALIKDHENLAMSLAGLVEGFCDLQGELALAKQLLVEKTHKSSEFFTLQEETSAKLGVLEEELKTYQHDLSLQQNMIEKLQHSEQQLLKRLEEETTASSEHVAALKRDYNHVMHQAQAAQEELARYRELQGRLLPLQRFFHNLSPLLKNGDNLSSFAQAASSAQVALQAVAPVSSNSSAGGSAMDFHEEAWEESHYAYGYRPVKNNFFET